MAAVRGRDLGPCVLQKFRNISTAPSGLGLAKGLTTRWMTAPAENSMIDLLAAKSFLRADPSKEFQHPLTGMGAWSHPPLAAATVSRATRTNMPAGRRPPGVLAGALRALSRAALPCPPTPMYARAGTRTPLHKSMYLVSGTGREVLTLVRFCAALFLLFYSHVPCASRHCHWPSHLSFLCFMCVFWCAFCVCGHNANSPIEFIGTQCLACCPCVHVRCCI